MCESGVGSGGFSDLSSLILLGRAGRWCRHVFGHGCTSAGSFQRGR